MSYQIMQWIQDSELQEIEYSEYWNDEEQEKDKVWYVTDGNYSMMEQYLVKTGLAGDLAECTKILKKEFGFSLGGTGIDLATGSMWAIPHLLEGNRDIKLIYCLELSKHRLLEIGPKLLKSYNIPQEKVVLVVGSFYKLEIADGTLDFVFMSAAFHHADAPEQLLSEIRRVLKPNGIVIILGEHVLHYRKVFIRHVAKFFISRLVPAWCQKRLFKKVISVPTIFPTFKELYPDDPIAGDHYYTDSEYYSMFSRFGFQIKHIKNSKSEFQSFLLIRKE